MAARRQELLPLTDASLGMLQVSGPAPVLALRSAVQGLSCNAFCVNADNCQSFFFLISA